MGQWKPLLIELGLIIGFYILYLLTRGMLFPKLDQTGLQNAQLIASLERDIGMFWEPGWQAWMLGNAEVLVVVVNWVYVITYWPIVLGVGLFLYIKYRRRFYFAVFPVASPFDITAHFVDTIQVLGPALYGSPETAVFHNTNAAMPSLHFCWTVVLGILFLRNLPGWTRLSGVLYPVITFSAITITGNHFILDAVAGGLLAGVAFSIVELGLRERFHLSR